ncbi:MAG: hypothetical protein QM479_15985 [Pseudomonadota bacterium]
MPDTHRTIFRHPEFRALLLIVGFCLFSWPVFSTQPLSIGILYGCTFLFWLLAIVMLFLHSR